MNHWWQEPFQLFQSNIRIPDGGMDTAAATRLIRRLGFDVWLLNAGGIVYFYPVTGDDQEMSPALEKRDSRDLIADALADARRQGLRLVARFDFSRLPSRFVEAKPAWAYRDSRGEMCTADGLTNICPRSDYYLERAPEILTDFVERYDVDGVFFNWLQFPEVSYNGDYYGPCHCERCLDAFRSVHPGAQYPTDPSHENYPLWVQLNRAHLDTLAQRYAALVKTRRPGAALFLADSRVDLVFLETNSHLGGGTHWWAHTPSELASVQLTANPEVPAIVHSAENVGLPYRMVGEEPAQFARYFAQALARGARPSVVVIGAPTIEHFSAFDAATPILDVYRENLDLYAALTPAAPVAVIRPRGGTAMAAMQDRSDFEEYRGLFESLQERHVPFDVLGTEHVDQLLARGVLARYRVIVVPGGTTLPPSLVDGLDAFARAGGDLVVTGDPASIVPLPGRLAVTAVLEGTKELGGRFGARPDGKFGDRLPVLGSFWAVEGADEHDWLLSEQAKFGPPELTSGNERFTPWPLRFRHPHGAGGVTHLPWTIGTTKRTSGLSSVSAFVAAEVRTILSDADTLQAELASTIELVVGRSGDTFVIHLINHTGRPDRLIDPVPARGRITLPGPRGEIRSLTGRPIGVHHHGATTVIDVEVGALEVIRID